MKTEKMGGGMGGPKPNSGKAGSVGGGLPKGTK